MTVDTSAAEAIRAHHAELAAQLHRLTGALLAAAGTGADFDAERAALHDWYRAELIPHVVAEERTLYAAGAELDATRLLVRGMLAEHQALVGLIADLGLAPTAFATATAAAAAHALFTVHLAKENDLLLPALQEAGVDIAELLSGMHELLGEPGADGDANHGCGCASERASERANVIGSARRTSSSACAHDEVPVADARVAVRFLDAPPGQPAPVAEGALDVRTLPHGQRHEIIFARLDALGADEELVIVNDHDPKPLRYQASALWPDRFEWTYREAGPSVWRIAISRAR